MKNLLLFIFPVFVILQTSCNSFSSYKNTLELDRREDWNDALQEANGITVHAQSFEGGQFDITGNGALLLQKTDTSKLFCHSDQFDLKGDWISDWFDFQGKDSIKLEVEVLAYGQKQDMNAGWTKFSGNPLICAKDWHLASSKSLQIPDTNGHWPNDPSLVRGRDEYEGKWILLFNIGGWAVGGWGMAVADSLEPIKEGINPFQIGKPFPLQEGIVKDTVKGYHAPNDWIYVKNTWYAPDESRDHHSRMWTSPDLLNWKLEGIIKGMQGHDPGMIYDGKYYYLFNEDGHNLQFCRTKDPLGEWEAMGTALEVGDHTGDADLCFFNNEWHMFFDDGEHFFYRIGYANASPSDFPLGWHKTNDIFGPHHPEQGQTWDDDNELGNGFGTGDADIALEGTTLYLIYERPVGIAYKELELTDLKGKSVSIYLETDLNDDSLPDEKILFAINEGGRQVFMTPKLKRKKMRIRIEMQTDDPGISPMISFLRLTGN